MMRDVDMTLHVSPELKLVRFEFGETNLEFVNRDEDATHFNMRRCPELSADQELKFLVFFPAIPPSNSFIEVRAASLDVAGPTNRRLVLSTTK
jgi:hypothetical protein